MVDHQQDWRTRYYELFQSLEERDLRLGQFEGLLRLSLRWLAPLASRLYPEIDAVEARLRRHTRLPAGRLMPEEVQPDLEALIKALRDMEVKHPRPLRGAAAASHLDDAAALAREVVLAVVGAMQVPADLAEQKTRLLARLQSADLEASDVRGPLLEAIVELVNTAICELEGERKDLEHFLSLTEKTLGALEQEMREGFEAMSQLQTERRQLQADFSLGVDELKRQMQSGAVAGDLKRTITAHLAFMCDALQAMDASEQRQVQQMQAFAQGVQSRVRGLEKEAAVMRRAFEETCARLLVDGVTGLPNHAALQKRLVSLAEQDGRSKRQKYLLALWNIDGMREINIRFGYQAGDRALRIIGLELNGRLTPEGYVARYEGDEFIILMPVPSLEEGFVRLDKVREAIQVAPFHYREEPLRITLSCGITLLQSLGEPLDGALQRAGKALQLAKQAGGNRCLPG
ncbi:MAG: GGDEF domain-containing protein [Pseudomonadota bacterium]